MAFLRYANARTVRPFTTGQVWDNVRVAAAQARMDRNLVDQASKILRESFDPSKYLLSHATIVASEDHRQKMSIARKGKPGIPHTEGFKRAVGDRHRGKVVSEDTRRKISESRKALFAARKTARGQE